MTLSTLTTESDASSETYSGVDAFIDIENVCDVCDMVRTVAPDAEVKEVSPIAVDESRKGTVEDAFDVRRRLSFPSALAIVFGRPAIYIGTALFFGLTAMVQAMDLRYLFGDSAIDIDSPPVIVHLPAMNALVAGIAIVCIWIILAGLRQGLRDLDIAIRWRRAVAKRVGSAQQMAYSDSGTSQNRYYNIGVYRFRINGEDFEYRQYRDSRHTSEENIEILYNPRFLAQSIAVSSVRRDIQIQDDGEVIVHGIQPRLTALGILLLMDMAVLPTLLKWWSP